MKVVIQILICMVAALILSINDFAWPAECEKLFNVVEIEQDQDGNTLFYISVTQWTQDNGTDSVCQMFGECILELIGTSPGMGAVNIINPEDEWVPSDTRWIDVHKAMQLADVDTDAYSWLVTSDYTERGDD